MLQLFPFGTMQEKDQYLGGYVGAAFFLVGAPAAILMGYMGGGYNRCTMFFWVVILGAPLPPSPPHAHAHTQTRMRVRMHNCVLS